MDSGFPNQNWFRKTGQVNPMFATGRYFVGMTALVAKAIAAELTILTVGQFGAPVSGCHVNSAQIADRKSDNVVQYRGRFQGLVGKSLPYGEYEIGVACGEAEAYQKVTLASPDQFEVFALAGRSLISDHVKPKLTVKMGVPPVSGETWWIRLVGIYNGNLYTDRFSPGTAEAYIPAPEPGSYLVTISSTKGYFCVREVDFVEFTNAWTFYPSNYSFSFDRFAHLVEEADKRTQKQEGWYAEMRAEREQVRRAIDRAISNK